MPVCFLMKSRKVNGYHGKDHYFSSRIGPLKNIPWSSRGNTHANTGIIKWNQWVLKKISTSGKKGEMVRERGIFHQHVKHMHEILKTIKN